METFDAVVVGAGVAGLSCARALADQGLSVVVVDRSARVGGRCASKPVGPGPVLDFGPVFVHGDDPEFLDLVEGLEGLVPGWPRVVQGRGTPCQPAAFDPAQRRYGLRGGVGSLTDALARGLDVRTGVEALSWAWDAALTVETSGPSFRGRALVWALAPEQTLGLLARGPSDPSVASARALLGAFGSLPCLAVLASYPAGTPVPDWDVWYPEASKSLLVVSNEGTKRGLSPYQGVFLTFQSRPGWAASRLESDRELWARDLLTEAAALVGGWASRPGAWTAHRWKYGRLAPSDHLARPAVFGPEGGARWALVGDLFDPDGGLQGAWRSGQVLARRLVAEGLRPSRT